MSTAYNPYDDDYYRHKPNNRKVFKKTIANDYPTATRAYHEDAEFWDNILSTKEKETIDAIDKYCKDNPVDNTPINDKEYLLFNNEETNKLYVRSADEYEQELEKINNKFKPKEDMSRTAKNRKVFSKIPKFSDYFETEKAETTDVTIAPVNNDMYDNNHKHYDFSQPVESLTSGVCFEPITEWAPSGPASSTPSIPATSADLSKFNYESDLLSGNSVDAVNKLHFNNKPESHRTNPNFDPEAEKQKRIDNYIKTHGRGKCNLTDEETHLNKYGDTLNKTSSGKGIGIFLGILGASGLIYGLISALT